MIRSFADDATADLSRRKPVPKFRSFEQVARRKLAMINAAHQLADLRIPPGNRLERLKGERRGQHSIRINDKYRVCFIWKGEDAYKVEITDYH